jgi:hypothetical protein
MASVFISHSSKDKDFVRQLAADLKEVGHSPWLDEWEIQVGDCIVRAVDSGLTKAEFVILVLSPNAVESGWVEREWAPSYWKEIESKRRVVLPAMLIECVVPTLLKTKKYADFRRTYAVGFAQIVTALGPVVEQVQSRARHEMPARDDEVTDILTAVQGRSCTLGECMARTLALAVRRGDAALQRFCSREIEGSTAPRIAKSDPDYPAYRLVEAYVSPYAEINMQYVGWGENASAVFDYMSKDDNFTQMSMLMPYSVAKLESMEVRDRRKSITHAVIRMRDLNPDAKQPETPVHVYTRAEAHLNVLEAIRGELSSRLLALLPARLDLE